MSNQFTKWLNHFTLPSVRYEHSNCFSNSLTLSILSHFNFSHYSGYIVVCNCWLIFISFLTNVIENPFMYLLTMYIYIFSILTAQLSWNCFFSSPLDFIDSLVKKSFYCLRMDQFLCYLYYSIDLFWKPIPHCPGYCCLPIIP